MLSIRIADYQWQVFDKKTGTWNDIPGANGAVLNPDKSLEGKQIQCTVTGKNDYTGQAVAEGVVRALPPVEKQTSETSITIEAEDGFEYEIRDKSGNIVISWVTDGGAKDGDGVTGSITFNGLKSDTSYDVVKRAADLAVTESRITENAYKKYQSFAKFGPKSGQHTEGDTECSTKCDYRWYRRYANDRTKAGRDAKDNIAAGRSDDWKRYRGIKNSDNCYEENYGAEDEIPHQTFESKRSKGKMQLQ